MVEMYSSVWPPGKAGIVIALGSRRDTLPILLDAIEGKKIPLENIDASTWRQFASVADWGLLNRARAIYPALEVTKDLGENIKTWEQKYNEERLASADASRGRTQWNSLCSQCHKLFGEGGAIGPELTGGQRNNLRYWLENILAPSNVVAESYRVTAFLTDDSRVITGVPIAETGREVTIQTAREKVVLSRSEIEQRRPSELSLMPDGILEPLDENARADLLKYLMSPAQVPAK
jgi:putative heme-binding domain-containing protein